MALQQDSISITQEGEDLLDVQLPQYYREGFFSKDSLFHPELPGGRFGVAGNPVPYSIHNDSVITSILLAFFILVVIAIANIHEFIVRQFKNFFYIPREGTSEMTETGTELRIQVFMVFLSSLLLSLLFYFYTIHYIGDTFVLESQYHLIAVYLVLMIVYFTAKVILYSVVNSVFFDSKRKQHWFKTLLFISSMEGLILFPAVLLQTYFDMSEENVILYFTIVLFFVKILTFFKCYVVFFRRNVVSLLIILYFCALEIVPLIVLGGILDMASQHLTINF
jgi:hypothetical protein